MISKIIYLVLVVTVLFACNSADDWQIAASNTKSKVEIEIIEISPGYYGYSISQHGRLLIEQKHIPAIQQFKPFVSRAQSERVGRLVKEKIECGIFPPTISVEELDSLRISH